jgi:hypothetical protein
MWDHVTPLLFKFLGELTYNDHNVHPELDVVKTWKVVTRSCRWDIVGKSKAVVAGLCKS